jgi:hypothetical protein
MSDMGATLKTSRCGKATANTAVSRFTRRSPNNRSAKRTRARMHSSPAKPARRRGTRNTSPQSFRNKPTNSL